MEPETFFSIGGAAIYASNQFATYHHYRESEVVERLSKLLTEKEHETVDDIRATITHTHLEILADYQKFLDFSNPNLISKFMLQPGLYFAQKKIRKDLADMMKDTYDYMPLYKRIKDKVGINMWFSNPFSQRSF